MAHYKLLHIPSGEYKFNKSFSELEDAQTQLSIILMYSNEWNNHPEMSRSDRCADYEIVEILDDSIQNPEVNYK